MTRPTISIVIPTWNGMATLPAVLDAVARQMIDADVELLCIDSASSDGTADYVRTHGGQVVSIDRRTFNHGSARNEAIGRTRGSYVVLLSQDAKPADEHWLASLVAPLLDDGSVAGASARQVPRPSTGSIGRHYHERWAGSSVVPRVSRVASAAAFEALSPAERLHACLLDNVCACIRRSVWEHLPFRPTAIAEDVEWARDALLAGHTLVYAPAAVVVHSHDRSPRYEFRRTALLHHRLYELFGLRTIPTLPHLARAIASSAWLHLHCRPTAGATMPVEPVSRALALAVAWPLGQWVGGRRGAQGLRSQPVDGV